MLTWKQFFESKEKENKKIEDLEEKLGVDLDGDEEKGESSEHKRKIKKAKQSKEDLEEKLGIDLDDDEEKGESSEHKRKIKKAKQKNKLSSNEEKTIKKNLSNEK